MASSSSDESDSDKSPSIVTAVNIGGGQFPGGRFGPTKKRKVYKGSDYRSASITHNITNIYYGPVPAEKIDADGKLAAKKSAVPVKIHSKKDIVHNIIKGRATFTAPQHLKNQFVHPVKRAQSPAQPRQERGRSRRRNRNTGAGDSDEPSSSRSQTSYSGSGVSNQPDSGDDNQCNQCGKRFKGSKGVAVHQRRTTCGSQRSRPVAAQQGSGLDVSSDSDSSSQTTPKFVDQVPSLSSNQQHRSESDGIDKGCSIGDLGAGRPTNSNRSPANHNVQTGTRKRRRMKFSGSNVHTDDENNSQTCPQFSTKGLPSSHQQPRLEDDTISEGAEDLGLYRQVPSSDVQIVDENSQIHGTSRRMKETSSDEEDRHQLRLSHVAPSGDVRPVDANIQTPETSQEMNESETSDDPQKDLMISYSWANKETVLKIKAGLENFGHQIWFDEDDASGDLVQSMADGVENSKIFLMCISQDYYDSRNCRDEAKYAWQLKKQIIPLKVQEGHDPKEGLGLIVGPKIYFNFSGTEKFESVLARLGKEIKRRMQKMKRNEASTPPSTKVTTATRKQTDDDTIKVGPEVYIYKNCILRTGYPVYKGFIEYLSDANVKPLRDELAVKFFYSHGYDKTVLKCLANEAKQMIKVPAHSNIVRFVHCHKVLEDGFGEYYIAMRLCHEETLRHIAVEWLTSDQRRNIFLQVCNGLEQLHKEKIAHLDLKPGNVLFSRDGTNAVISDFGLSKNVVTKTDLKTGKTTVEKSGSLHGGTEGWVAAEMVRSSTQSEPTTRKGRKKQTTKQSGIVKPDFLKADIFALGLVGHYIFYDGVHPFSDSAHPDMASRWEVNIHNKKKPSLGSSETKCDDPAEIDLFGRMLSHDPLKRPTIQEVQRHWVFWSPTNKRNFLIEMYDHYLDDEDYRKKFQENGTEEQKLAYATLCETEALSRAGARTDVVSTTTPSTDVPPETSESDTVHGMDANQNVDRKPEIRAEIREVLRGCWMKKTTEPIINRAGFRNSLYDLVRYVRHQVVQDTRRYTVEYWTKPFPKLVPYLHRILKADFTDEHRREYNCKAVAGDIDVKSLLESEKPLSFRD